MISPIVKKPMTSATITLDWASCAFEMFRTRETTVFGEMRVERVAKGAARRFLRSGEKVALKTSALLWGVSGNWLRLGADEWKYFSIGRPI